MPALRNYHIFISHSWDYNNHYETIKGWLDDSLYFDWTDYSVPISNPLTVNGVNDLRKRISDRISLCSSVIILSGMYVKYSTWIDFEINTAVTMNKPIIGVRPWGQERVPINVQNNATEMVGWNSSSVIDAIRKYSL